MVVPDFELICEIMLVAEGFQEAKILARKFITLYTLCKELLSKQDHYDWGLRAIKSVLVVAGSLKVKLERRFHCVTRLRYFNSISNIFRGNDCEFLTHCTDLKEVGCKMDDHHWL